MPSDTATISDLEAQSALADIRLRVNNRETVTVDEYRTLLDNLRRSRDNTARLAKQSSAAKSRENRKAQRLTAPSAPLDLGALFGKR